LRRARHETLPGAWRGAFREGRYVKLWLTRHHDEGITAAGPAAVTACIDEQVFDDHGSDYSLNFAAFAAFTSFGVMQAGLCARQCARWHAVLQYRTAWHLEQALSLMPLFWQFTQHGDSRGSCTAPGANSAASSGLSGQ
jgi:hypothetical protein